MKVSILLIILGFSQVLGRNYGSLTESKSEREDQIEEKSSEDNNIEMGEMVNNKMASSEAARSGIMCRARHCTPQFAPSELEQPKTECDYIYGNGLKTRCSSNEDCKECSDCPEGVWECDLKLESDTDGPFCQCDDGFAG